MKLSQRQQQVLQRVQREGFAAIEQLAESFAVTPQTVRRDINELCSLGLLRRYHGGAGLPSTVENIAYNTRQVLYLEEKRRIATLLAEYLPDQASLFINLGTTNEEVARALLGHQGLRVISNNLNVANILCENKDFQVLIAGGMVRHRDRGITGEAAVDFIRKFRVDYAVLGISGIDRDGTLLDYDYQEIRVAEAMMANSRQVLMVADHSKFTRTAMVRLGHLRQVDALFTDRPVPDEMIPVFREAETEILVAG